MTAISAASATAHTITPPSSSHGNGNQTTWNNYAVGDTLENTHGKTSFDKHEQANRAHMTHNGNSANSYEYGFEPLPPARKKASNDNLSLSKGSKSWDRTNRRDHDTSKPGFNSADDVFGDKGGVGDRPSTNEPTAEPVEDENSKWIHRDKLARIESQELQAAGIILPRVRASSRPRRGRSQEKINGSFKRTTSIPPDEEIVPPRSRKSSISPENRVLENMPDLDVHDWDLRRPEEIAAADGDEGYWTSIGEKKGVSKIPVAKASPAPIPESYIERNAPSGRRRSGGSELETIAYPKPRPRSGSTNTLGSTSMLQPAKRSATDLSPRKGSGSTSASNRKASTQAKPAGRAKTRSGKDSTSSISGFQRSASRSNDLSINVKKPEGDPPWMVGTYRPDPRLPPEQQLLPTVAKRLQQEQWEREGKYGSIYDKDFRPLTADGLLRPPEAGSSTTPPDDEQQQDEWPLKGDAPKSPTAQSPTSSSIKQSTSYSTMPKISDKPQTSPLPSPRSPMVPNIQPEQPPQTQTVIRVPETPSAAANMSMGGEKKKSGGCGCCIVM
ncbi:hypothetical protein CCHL11_02458 [Colletotrichum chlorophyti]|uniref:TeaA receptor TeaR n=1 Tax=Colletotrichum chlorophyti TaxID=708187 RepID=A0A1Q8S5V9_9PEZI|nr:hypothetical protein CCHL11_02458 [Colletotrichum chlorophyti]